MAIVLAVVILACSSCSSWSNTGKGAAIGAGSGAAVGAGLGAIFGGGKGAAIGAAVGGVVGTGAGAAIGKKMDRQKAEIEQQVEGAKVETVTDVNNLQAITIYGHTDNTGSRAVNEKLSLERATAVANFLVGQGISRDRIKTEGLAFDAPVADNSTPEGRAANRRVEVYITANEQMIRQAEAGNL